MYNFFLSFTVILFIIGYCFEIPFITFDMNFQDFPILFFKFVMLLKIYPKVIWKWIYTWVLAEKPTSHYYCIILHVL